MKKVTKKLVNEILSSFTGWGFAYNYKESQKIYLGYTANAEKIQKALADNGVKVIEYLPVNYPRTGNMKLSMQSQQETTRKDLP